MGSRDRRQPARAHPRGLAALVVLGLCWPGAARAHGNRYPFDYDPALSEDPDGIRDDLAHLNSLLPGLPEGLVEIEMGGIAFDYFPEVLDMIQRARDCGPDIAPAIQRDAIRCAAHAAFSMPGILQQPASSSCLATETDIRAAFEGNARTCQEVEYPEVYVLDHPPGVVDANVLGQSELLSTLEGQIALIGEALSHIDYPVGLIPDSVLPLARSVIAKIRYQTLSDKLDARLAAYAQARTQLQSAAACFDSAASASLRSDIDALVTELTAVKQHLDQLYDDGLAQAAQDRLAVENQGRLRNDLPEPALTDHEREMLAFYLSAIYWRMRGGGLIRNPDNGSVPDITYVTNIFEGIARFAGGLEDAASVGTRYAIDESYGYAEWWDMGNEPGHDQYYDLLWMTDRGRRGVNLVRQMIGDLGYDIRPLVAGGLIMGPCYYYMWYELWARNGRYFQLGEDLTTPYYAFDEMPVAGGEVCYGGAMGLGLARTLLWGRPDPDCVADCSGRSCGSDGCGGRCGICDGVAVCTSAGQCVQPGTDAGVEPTPDAAAFVDAGAPGSDASAPPADAAHTDLAAVDAAPGDTSRSATDLGSEADTHVAGADAGGSDGEETGAVASGCPGCGSLPGARARPAWLLLVATLAIVRRRRD